MYMYNDTVFLKDFKKNFLETSRNYKVEFSKFNTDVFIPKRKLSKTKATAGLPPV